LGCGYVAQAQVRQHQRPLGKLARYLFVSPQRLEVDLPGPLHVGDAVFDGDRAYLGRVSALPEGAVWTGELDPAPTYQVTLEIDPEVTLPSEPRFRTSTAPVDAAWILETLLPPEKRDYVIAELTTFAEENEDAIAEVVRPMAEDTIEHGMTVLEANLKEALAKRDAEIQALLDAHRATVRDDLLPVLKAELGPSAKKKAEPILTEIGRELWNELPMWSLSWRVVVDKIPGTQQDRTEQWWKEFLETKAIPIVAAHEEDLIKALEELIEEGAKNPKVRRALSDATRRLAKDPRFKAIVRGVLEDALVRPFDVGELSKKLLADPEHRARIRDLSHRFGPTLQRIGKKLTTDPETGGIDPDLARVLRRVVFRKDRRWVELEGPPLSLIASPQPPPGAPSIGPPPGTPDGPAPAEPVPPAEGQGRPGAAPAPGSERSFK
jgi:hypothetical protein